MKKINRDPTGKHHGKPGKNPWILICWSVLHDSIILDYLGFPTSKPMESGDTESHSLAVENFRQGWLDAMLKTSLKWHLKKGWMGWSAASVPQRSGKHIADVEEKVPKNTKLVRMEVDIIWHYHVHDSCNQWWLSPSHWYWMTLFFFEDH